MSRTLGEGTHDTFPCKTEHVETDETSNGRGTGMNQTYSQANFGVQVRARTRPRTVASFVPIALFVALVTALAFIN